PSRTGKTWEFTSSLGGLASLFAYDKKVRLPCLSVSHEVNTGIGYIPFATVHTTAQTRHMATTGGFSNKASLSAREIRLELLGSHTDMQQDLQIVIH
ncbi:hypothetical protein, partial [Chromobacterium amazonense]|uniref:hypothetical protein n=1 Tax=Chromobacterium amazonense TaxID=1382803 RepID=UPI001CB8B856